MRPETYKFKRGEIVRANVDYYASGQDNTIIVGRTYVVSKRSKDEHGHCYITILAEDNRGFTVTQAFFSKVR